MAGAGGGGLGQEAARSQFTGAVRWSKFGPALALAEAGADADWRDATSRPLFALGAGLDTPDATGRTARQIMARKRDPP